jgi:hypothetical protein
MRRRTGMADNHDCLPFGGAVILLRQTDGSSRSFQGPRRRGLGLLYVLHFRLRDVLPETDASTTGRALSSRIDQFDPGILQCRNQFHQRIDVPADNSVAGFHALNGRYRKIRQVGRLPLVYI